MSETATMTITEFLLARYAEEEAVARAASETDHLRGGGIRSLARRAAQRGQPWAERRLERCRPGDGE